jgi:hypothetical protein
MNEQFEASLKVRRRQLSRFMAREMLLDYAENRLDDDRKLALEEYLPRDKEVQKEFESIKLALGYTATLSRIQLAEQTVNEIERTKLGLAKVTDRMAWRNWPEVVRWSAEAILVSVVVAAVVSLLPLQKLAKWLPSSSQELVLAEIEKSPDKPLLGTGDRVADALARSADEDPETQETLPASSRPAVPAPPAPTPAANTAATAYGPTTDELKAGLKTLTVATAPPVANTPVPAQETAALKAEEETPAPKTGKEPKGFVYRAFMASSSIDESTSGVRDLIMSLGGEKAGQVELGWRKNSGTYFHFAIPESNYETLMTGLRTFSPVRIYKDPHWRVMPEGQIRLILFIEDTASKK